jgi:hypothetical protein
MWKFDRTPPSGTCPVTALTVQVTCTWLGTLGVRDRLRCEMRKLPLSILIAISLCALTSCNVPIFSYPYWWDYTKTRPDDAHIVGTYGLLKTRLPSDLERAVREKQPVIALSTDHTATLTDVPEFDPFGQKLVCRLSGTAIWALDDGINDGWGGSVAFKNYRPTVKPTSSECVLHDSMWTILILSRKAPYRLYVIIGDPDSDTGVEYKRISPDR